MNREPKDILIRDTSRYDIYIERIIGILAEEPFTLVEALGIMDAVKNELHEQRYEDRE